MSIEGGKLRMSQIKTTENFLRVMVGIASSTPNTMSPWKSGKDNWSKEVENKKLVIVSVLKH
jgi:hypothetical protein